MSDKAYDRIFSHGSQWVRSDFHLHTNADKEFSYAGDGDKYLASYADALEAAGISLGAITNHNKFEYNEFKNLRKKAKKKGIFLLPGVELSVNDGRNGIHTLVVFSNEWLENGQNYINSFLGVVFEGKTPDQYENKNGRASLSLIDTIKKLEGYQRDFFLIFAHVEDKNGIWDALDGGRLEELGKDECFRRRTLAFQKVRTHDVPGRNCRVKVKKLLKDFYPAEVEGSDSKAIEEIGRGDSCYLKIGDFTFEAVKCALLDHHRRVSESPLKHNRSHIQSLSFDGGRLDGQTIRFSPELNTLIGIRGSGKSSILEALRYALDIPFGEKAMDTNYKSDLVDHVLGSGGKVTVRAADWRGHRYEIRRINKELPDIYVGGVLRPGISIRETIVHQPVYFGQKDLSSTGEGFEKDLMEKLVGEKLVGIRSSIENQRQKVSEIVAQLKMLASTDEKKKEYIAQKQDAEFRLGFYKNHGMEEKLQKQLDFDADARKCAQVVSFVKNYLTELEVFVNEHEDDLKNQPVYTSKQNKDFFEDFFEHYSELTLSFEQIQQALSDSRVSLKKLQEKTDEFEKLRSSLKEEFAAIERKLADQLRQNGVQTIRPDEFRQLQSSLDQATQMIQLMDKQEDSRKHLNNELLKELAALSELWREEYKMIQAELEKVSQSHSSLEIKVEFKGDKPAFISYMKDIFRGSRIRETTFSTLTETFADFGALYRESDKAKILIGNSAAVFEEYFRDNLSALLTWQVPNRFIIEYREKELRQHSLGQRASALILFVLSQKENDLIIIDQPEDDLDNQTIYEDLIKLIHDLKPNIQFIFATHNANFPVLGDAEQIISCACSDKRMSVKTGSIDCPEMQKEIVD
ncbi:MAG: histidinol-phosphatase, partial [Deltaproteobacteria bacterium]